MRVSSRRNAAPLAVLLFVLGLVLAVPAATVTADKPVKGGFYSYVKESARLPWWRPGQHEKNYVNAQVGSQGTRVDVGWTLWAGNGCIGRFYGHKPKSIPSGTMIKGIPVKADGSFHRSVQKKGKYINYFLVETRGQFLAGGDWVRVSIRQKSSTAMNASNWDRCDGRWLTFRACLWKKGACGSAHTAAPTTTTTSTSPSTTPAPPTLPYEIGSYQGTTAQGESIRFQVAAGFVKQIEIRATLHCSDGSSEAASEFVDQAVVTGTHFSAQTNETGDDVTVAGDLGSNTAAGSLRVTRAYDERTCDSGAVSFTARKE